MSIEDLKRSLKSTKSKAVVKDSAKSEKPKSMKDKIKTNVGASSSRYVSLRGLEVTYWSDKATSSNSLYPVKFSISVSLKDKHIRQLESAKESAIQVYIEENDLKANALDKSNIELKLYTDKEDRQILTFRSSDDYKEIAEYDEEPLSHSVMIGKGSMINASISAKIYKTAGGLLVTFYMNAIVITELVERDYKRDLLESLRD